MKTLWLAVALAALIISWHEWRMFVFREELPREKKATEERIAGFEKSTETLAQVQPEREYVPDILKVTEDARKVGVVSREGLDSALRAAREAGDIRSREVGTWDNFGKASAAWWDAYYDWVNRETLRNRLLTALSALIGGAVVIVSWRRETRRHLKDTASVAASRRKAVMSGGQRSGE